MASSNSDLIVWYLFISGDPHCREFKLIVHNNWSNIYGPVCSFISTTILCIFMKCTEIGAEMQSYRPHMIVWFFTKRWFFTKKVRTCNRASVFAIKLATLRLKCILYLSLTAGDENHEVMCRVKPLCPGGCTCNSENVVDCRGIGLTELPSTFPDGSVEL